MELDYLREILKLLVMIAILLGLTIPDSALELLGEATPSVPPTPTQEVFNDYGVFTPYPNYTINVRASCSRTAVRQSQITSTTPYEIDKGSIFVDGQGYTWAKGLNGGCVVIAYNDVAWGIVR